MAYSYVEYAGNGVLTDFTITFPYILSSHVKVYLSGTLSTAWSLLNASTVRMTAAPGVGVTVRIIRETDRTARLVDFQDAAGLTAESLDLSADQQFYLTQEAVELSSLPYITSAVSDAVAAKNDAEAALASTQLVAAAAAVAASDAAILAIEAHFDAEVISVDNDRIAAEAAQAASEAAAVVSAQEAAAALATSAAILAAQAQANALLGLGIGAATIDGNGDLTITYNDATVTGVAIVDGEMILSY